MTTAATRVVREGLDAERAIAWRAADSFALREFPGLLLPEAPPDHSTIIPVGGRVVFALKIIALIVATNVVGVALYLSGRYHLGASRKTALADVELKRPEPVSRVRVLRRKRLHCGIPTRRLRLSKRGSLRSGVIRGSTPIQGIQVER